MISLYAMKHSNDLSRKRDIVTRFDKRRLIDSKKFSWSLRCLFDRKTESIVKHSHMTALYTIVSKMTRRSRDGALSIRKTKLSWAHFFPFSFKKQTILESYKFEAECFQQREICYIFLLIVIIMMMLTVDHFHWTLAGRIVCILPCYHPLSQPLYHHCHRFLNRNLWIITTIIASFLTF
jgi:hypothetical protein